MDNTNTTIFQEIERRFANATELGEVRDAAHRAAATIAGSRKDLHNGPADAFRHMVFVGELTRRYGPSFAKAGSNLHEILGNDADQPASESDMDHHNNAVGVELGKRAQTWDDVIRMAREKMAETVEQGNDTSAKDRPYWIRDVPVDQWAPNWKTREFPPLEGGGPDERYLFNDLDAEDDENNGDESAKVDDGDARIDAAGRMIQADHPETPAPARPLSASVAETGVDLDREIGRVVDAVFAKARPRSAPHPEPDEGRVALMLRQARHEGKGPGSRPAPG